MMPMWYAAASLYINARLMPSAHYLKDGSLKSAEISLRNDIEPERRGHTSIFYGSTSSC